MSLAPRTALRAARIATPLRSAIAVRAAHTFAVPTSPRTLAPRRPQIQFKMASSTASLTTAAEVKAGSPVPSVSIRIGDMNSTIDFAGLKGKNVIVTVPGAFTPTCHSQVPGYIELYEQFKGKGVNEIYIVSVNDLFVVNAWKKDLLSQAGLEPNESVKFAGDDKGELTHALGIVLDATGGLGNLRSKRSVIVIEDGKVVSIKVEPDSGKSTVTQADDLIKTL